MTLQTQNSGERERVVDFATRWMLYGGGPAEDIMVTFGISPDTYFRRLRSALLDSDLVGLDRATAAALLRVCERRLDQSSLIRDRVTAPQ